MLAFVPLRIFLFHEHIARWDDILFAGHLWYLEHVLLFSLVYALVVWLRRGQRRTNVGDAERRHGPPNLAVMLASLLCIAVVSAIVRFWSPIDRWFNLLGFFRVAFADVPRDLSFFVFGAVAARRDWVRIYPRKAGFAWLSVGILASASYYLWALVPAFHFKFVDHVYGLVYPFWEEIVCFGMCIGLVVFFREFVNHAGRLARFLRANQYSAYFWHPLILVLLQKAALQLAVPPGPKFVLVTVIAVPLVFLWSAFVRRSRIVRKVL